MCNTKIVMERDVKVARQELKEYIADLGDEARAHLLAFVKNPQMPKGIPHTYYEQLSIGYKRCIVDMKNYLERKGE